MTDGTMMGGLAAGGSSQHDTEVLRESSGARTLWFIFMVLQFLFAFQASGYMQKWFGINLFNNNTLIFTIPLFTGLSIWAWLLFKKGHLLEKDNLKLLFYFLFISACYILIVPTITEWAEKFLSIGALSIAQLISFMFYIIFPWWPDTVARYSGDPNLISKTHLWINIALIFLLLLFIFYFATSLTARDLISRGGSGEIVQATNVIEFITDAMVKTLKNTWKALSFADNIKSLINATGIAYYTGTVDQNEKAPVGLYITNVRAQDRVSYVGTPAVVWADIEGKSFTETMKITPFCYTDGSGNKRIEGEPSPASFEIFGEEHDSIRCTFDGLQKGTYRAMVGAGFNFETWAYVTYTFVDLELSRSMAIEGKNINSELDIPHAAQAVYSNGPIMIGMGTSVDQPVGVDKVKNDRDPIIGVTLSNKWTDGHLERVNEFILQVPDDFDLMNCDRGAGGKATPFETKEGYNYYKFTREALADPRIEFLSLTCRLHLKEPSKFLSGQQKVQRTFATQVKYDYYIQKSATVTVKE
jgi:hypothetical protein